MADDLNENTGTAETEAAPAEAEPAAALTPEELLAQVDTAIQKILVGGQSYKIGSRSLTRADLALLRSMRADLQGQIANEANSHLISDAYVAVFDTR